MDDRHKYIKNIFFYIYIFTTRVSIGPQFLFMRPYNVISLYFIVLLDVFENASNWLSFVFTQERFLLAAFPLSPDWRRAALILDLLEVSPSSSQHLCSSLKLAIGFSLTSLSKVLSNCSFSLGGQPALGRVLVVPRQLYLW